MPDAGRICARCGRWLSAEHFRANSELKSGLHSYCRACHAAFSREWYAERRIPLTEHVCTECGTKFLGRRGKLVCSRRCTDARYRRLHPEAYREAERQKHARRRARCREERKT